MGSMSRFRRAAALLLAIALFAALVAAPSIATAAVATVQGTVTDSASSALAGIHVTIQGENLSAPFWAEALTDGAGNYSFGVPEVGDYLVSTDDPGGFYVPSSHYLTGVTSGIVTSDFTLVGPGGISGSVIDSATSLPVVAIDVMSLRLTGDFEYWDGSALTDPYGAYLIMGAVPGPHAVFFTDLSARAIPYADQWFDGVTDLALATTVTVNPGATTSAIDARLVAGTSVSGRVTDSVSGLPLGDVIVQIQNDATADLVWTSTAANGTYRISGLPFGTYTVLAQPQSGPDPVTPDYDAQSALGIVLALGQTSRTVNFALVPVAAGYMTGTTLDGQGAPIAGVEVSLAMGLPSDNAPVLFSTVTAADGSFSLPPRTGAITIYFFDPTGLHPALVASVTAAGPGGLGTFVMASTGSISGLVTDSNRTPLPGTFVQLWQASDAVAPIDSALVGLDGFYTFGLLDPGDYKVSFMDEGYLPEFFHNAQTFAEATTITIQAGDVERVDAVLSKTAMIPTSLTASWRGTSATTISPAYGASVYIQGRLTASDTSTISATAVVDVQQLVGDDWVTVGPATRSSSGLYSRRINVTSRAIFRLSFAGDAVYEDSVSRELTVNPHVKLSLNSLHSSYRHNRSFTVSGHIAPAHTAGSRSTVYVKLYRLRGGHWRIFQTVSARIGSSGTTFSATVNLKTVGRWKLVPFAPGDSQHASTTGSARYTRAR